MSNFFTLYIYELKKICKRKIVVITMSMLIVLAVFIGVGGPLMSSYSVSHGEDTVTMSGFEYLARERENAESISGQKIDDAMLQEVKEAYQRMHVVSSGTEEIGITMAAGMMTVEGIFDDETMEDREEIFKKREQYKEIYDYVNDVMGNYEAIHSINEDILYQERSNKQQSEWTEQKLTEEEKAYWTEKENEIEKPFVYGYAGGWKTILSAFPTLNVMLVLAIVICLSNVFSDEHLRKTDQLILCSKYGKKKLFFAKTAAGISFGLGSGAVLLTVTMFFILCVCTVEGFGVAVQVYLPLCSLNITMGQAVIFMSMVYMVAGVFYSIIAMFLSEAMKNSVAVMGIMTGSMFFTMFVSVPYRFRVISQIYELLPTVLIGLWQLWDNRLFRFFGAYLTNFQIAPVIYIIISVVLIVRGSKIYGNYQVSGR